MSSFELASQVDILRAVQKDALFSTRLTSKVLDVCDKLCGPHLGNNYLQEVVQLSKGLYTLFTNVINYSSLGEEYCGIIQVQGNAKESLPTTYRLYSCILQTIFSYTYSVLDEQNLRGVASKIVAKSKELGVDIQMLNSILAKSFLALFYFEGKYYDLAKRILGVQLQQTRRSIGNKPYYGALAFVLMLQILLTVYTTLDLRKQQQQQQQQQYAQEDNQEQLQQQTLVSNTIQCNCPLCLQTTNVASSTPCGHIFCWECIMEWCNNRQECPVCRVEVAKNQIVPLYN
eukprot:TRINITY_DN17819_c0_g1_i1.p1 TRINITY_DN17819_c0_g1~~TRINITY_DN17819_c0_g1_i1.p1  ORF type:complete len:287 (+),score=23.10 TRINITY_DN17819_c0_g1_i1:280-1140(+)